MRSGITYFDNLKVNEKVINKDQEGGLKIT